VQLLISDSNILIDFIVVDQIENMFRLPYSFAVPDILFVEELKKEHEDLLGLGLKVMSLKSEAIAYVGTLAEKYSKPGRNDLFALALAQQESCPLLTGDNDLRDAAEKEAVILYGTIWVMDHLVSNKLLGIDEAREVYSQMKEKKRRLPWDVAEAHLNELSKKY
jgi:predicted nucleic acid-binding protein